MKDQPRHYAAVDLGATSGRVILGTVACPPEPGEAPKVTLEELKRISHAIIDTPDGHKHWDMPRLMEGITEGLREAAARGVTPCSIGVDTWGVDVALFDARGRLLDNPLSYRDPHTQGEPGRLAAEGLTPEKLFSLCGLQEMAFNTIFQLSAMRRGLYAPLAKAERVLLMPNAVTFMLTGRAVTERTIASTTGLLNPLSGFLDPQLLQAAGVREEMFGPLVEPGTVIGPLSEAVQAATGLGPVPVVAVAGHDTASAVAAIPHLGPDDAFLSSGTWSLMGALLDKPVLTEEARAAHFTNEGGLEGTIRFLTNICGMWLLERCRAEWHAMGVDTDYAALIAQAESAGPSESYIYPDAPCFAMPDSMLLAIEGYCNATGQPMPQTPGGVTRLIFDSLAMRYREVLASLRRLTGRDYSRLCVIGGGSRNALLCQITADTLGLPVQAGPTECTALGNILVQAMADGLADTPEEIHRAAAASCRTVTYLPDAGAHARADKAFDRYLEVKKNI